MRANKKNLKEEPNSKPDALQQVHKNFKTLKEEPSSKTEVWGTKQQTWCASAGTWKLHESEGETSSKVEVHKNFSSLKEEPTSKPD
jgi:hypothetical protein